MNGQSEFQILRSSVKQQRRQQQRKRRLKIKICEIVPFFMITASSSHPLLLTEHAANELVEAPLK